MIHNNKNSFVCLTYNKAKKFDCVDFSFFLKYFLFSFGPSCWLLLPLSTPMSCFSPDPS